MNIIFYNSNFEEIKQPDTAPLSVIRTLDSTNVSECQLTVTEDYKDICTLGNFIVLSGENEVYRIVAVEYTQDTEIEITVTAQELAGLILSNRITPEDTYDSTEGYLQSYITREINKSVPLLSGAKIYFEADPSKYSDKSSQLWSKGTSFFEYLQKESEHYQKPLICHSYFSKSSGQRIIICYAGLVDPVAQPPLFLPSEEIRSFTVNTTPQEFTQLTLSAYLYPYFGDMFALSIPWSTWAYNNSINPLDVIQKTSDYDPTQTTAATWCKLAGFTVTGGIATPAPLVYSDNSDTDGATHTYCYVAPNAEITINAYISATQAVDMTVKALRLLVLNLEDYNIIKNSHCYGTTFRDGLPQSVNGEDTEFQYLVKWSEKLQKYIYAGDSGDQGDPVQTVTYNGNSYYEIIIILVNGSLVPVAAPTRICIADQEKSLGSDPRYNVTCMKPISIAGIEQKLMQSLPTTTEQKDITVEFSEDATADVGDKIQVVAGRSLFAGVVTAKTEAWENGTYKTDIEVKEWTAED